MLSLSQIFKDLCPMFILNKEELEKKMKEIITKEERQLVLYEYTILTLYEKYIEKIIQIKDQLKD